MTNADTVRNWRDRLYLATLVRNQPRAIDRYIDYFGFDVEVSPRRIGTWVAETWR
jgi:hypothetical protein